MRVALVSGKIVTMEMFVQRLPPASVSEAIAVVYGNHCADATVSLTGDVESPPKVKAFG